MDPSMNRQQRQRIFAWIVLGCIALAVGYTAWILLRSDTASNMAQAPLQAPATLQPTISPQERMEIQKGEHLLFLHPAGPHYGQVALAAMDQTLTQRAHTSLACDRIYYAAGNGICLLLDTSVPAQDPLAPSNAQVTLFGPDLQPRHQFTTEGLPSRARVSPDGKYAAFTVFVSGHSYMDANLSTASFILETATGTSLGNLEDFETWKDGQPFQAIDFNFWGVTFAQDSNLFYATLRSNHTNYLVQGDIAARRMTVLHRDVECPSVSPDGTRIAFKKLTLTGIWQLTVLDLATMQETTLAERDHVDDQVEWLDDERILYQKDDPDAPMSVSVFVVPADGSGQPAVFIPEATSPVVVHN